MEVYKRQKNERKAKREILFRPRINKLLGQAAEHSLVTVTAGTGYGKTQAVAAFLEHEGIHNISLQLTKLDNYPARFWDVFTQAVQAGSPSLSRDMAAMGFPSTMEKTYRFLRMFSQAVYGWGRCVLVLDDFHRIEEAGIINLVETLSFANIENFTIILITRYPLHIDYSTLQADGLHANISVGDLRFTMQETRSFYAQMRLNFSDKVLENIQASTEGWPLAINLIGLHRGKQGLLFNDPVQCTIPLLYSLMEMEIFSAYSEEIQRNFIKLSLIETVPLNLMQALCGTQYPTMVTLLRKNMFVNYNPQTEQYQFHRLFRLFLREKQVLFTDEELEHIYLAIGDWHAENGKLIEALTYYDLCGNHQKIWSIVRRHALSEKLFAVSLELLDKFPPEFVEASPEINVMRAHLLMCSSEIETAYQMAMDIYEEYNSMQPTAARRAVMGEACLCLALTSIMKNRADFAEYFRKASEYLPGGSTLIHPEQTYVGNNCALFLFSDKAGEVERMVDLLFKVMPGACQAMNGLGYGMEYQGASEAAFFQDKLGQASEYAHQAIYHAQQKKQHDIVYNGFAMLGRICFAQGDYEGSREYLRLIKQYGQSVETPQTYGMDDIAESWLYAKLDMPERIKNWISGSSISLPDQTVGMAGREKVVQAYIMLDMGEYYELLALTEYMEKISYRRNLRFLRMQALAIRALCYHLLGDMAGALGSLRRVYRMCYANGLSMVFIEYGGRMAALLEALAPQLTAENGFDAAWLQGVRRRALEYETNKQYVVKEYKLAFSREDDAFPPLSPLEHSLLAGLCNGATREEIAASCGISIATAKSMLKDVFSKLGAINRADAIRIAQANNLVTQNGLGGK